MNPMLSAPMPSSPMHGAVGFTPEPDAATREETARDRRLAQLAAMGSDLRAPLHALLGGVQMLRLDGELTASQSSCVDTIMAAGTLLLERVFAILDLSDEDAETLLPVHSPASVPAGAAEAPAPALARALQVLVVDDIAMNRDIAAAFLRAAGHDVTVAESGADAFVAAAARKFDVILLDLRMPGMDGLETTRRIRALPGTLGRTPIVAMTALAHEEEVEECRRAGMTGHLAKPFRQDTLTAAVQRAVASAAPAPAPAPLAATTARDGMPSYLRVMAAERDRLGPAGAAASPPAAPWIDIDSAWNRQPRVNGQRATPAAPAETAFTLRLTDVGLKGGQRRLVGPVLSCIPPQDRDQHEFHWLLYLHTTPSKGGSFTGRCDMWRWHRSAWHSITAQGAVFGAEEMFEQGWRYCGPCMDPVARVEVI